MRQSVWVALLLAGALAGCSKGKYDNLADASGDVRAAAEKMWDEYLTALGNRQVGKNPMLVAKFFSGPLLASTNEAEFRSRIVKTQKKRSAGAFERVTVAAVKTGHEGLLMIVDSKAGQAAIPVVQAGDQIKFAELMASTGDWAKEAKPGPSEMPADPSLLYIKVVLQDEQAPVGDRLRAAIMLVKTKYRKEIVSHQRTVKNPVVRLGLGLARIKIDGSDESFIKNFPTDSNGISAIRQADKDIFEEMITKLSNMGGLVEDPPANEVMYKVAAGAPSDLRDRMAKALYNMAELNPARMANAVRNVATDASSDSTFEIYLEEVKRQDGKAPKMTAFLRKFSRIGESEERKLCNTLLSRIGKAK